MRNSVTYPIWRRMLGYTYDQQLFISVTSWHLAVKYPYQYLGMSMFNNIMSCVPMFHKGLQVNLSQIILGISMLIKIFLLHAKL